MGIEWHVLVDGDEAGKKYASTVRSLLNNEREEERDHLTMLPAMDMEHFMYRQGFDDVFHRVAMVPVDVPMNMRRVIAKAIHRSSKPDLAIEVATEAGRGRGGGANAAAENVLPRAVAGTRESGLTWVAWFTC
jgi:putative ATP-dependent endonuclease of OLD family